MSPTRDSAPNPERTVSRRRVLKVGSGGALALVIGTGAGWVDRRNPGDAAGSLDFGPGSPTPTTTTPASSTTTAPLVIPEIGEVVPAIVTLGRRVIDVTGESDLGRLLALLPATDGGDPVAAATARITADFVAGDTIVVDGWVLAASEARAAAVIALLCTDAC